MRINGVEIDDGTASARTVQAVRLLVTGDGRESARAAARAATGFAFSLDGCGLEAAIDHEVPPEETPDGRPGVQAMLCFPSEEAVEAVLPVRIGAVMGVPSSACYNGLPLGEPVRSATMLRRLGNGYQCSKLVGGRRLWRIPVLDGEFLAHESFNRSAALAGAGFVIMAETPRKAGDAARAAVEAVGRIPGAMLPGPDGGTRFLGRRGSKYRGVPVSTDLDFCPTLMGTGDTALAEGTGAALAVFVNGLDEQTVRRALAEGVNAACLPGVIRIAAAERGHGPEACRFSLRGVLGLPRRSETR